ncbi:MAG TPA: helix-turn-helix domain-containing protein [Dongiaceae bacterium]|nr:helix-turn-helix domain-containing protein [Dongiaceae bacterium]
MTAKGKPKGRQHLGRQAVNGAVREPLIAAPRPAPAGPGQRGTAPARLQPAPSGSPARTGLPPAGRPLGGPVTPALGRPGGPPPELHRGVVPDLTLLMVYQVARRLGVTTQHVRDFIEEGDLRAINVGKGLRKFWRIPLDAYQAFLKSRGSPEP